MFGSDAMLTHDRLFPVPVEMPGNREWKLPAERLRLCLETSGGAGARLYHSMSNICMESTWWGGDLVMEIARLLHT